MRGVGDHGERHHFQRAEHRTPGQGDGRRAGEVQVMAGADDAAGQEDRGREQRRLRGEGRADQAQAREEEGDHGGGEDLEEAFHPQVDHPPAPVFDDGQVGVLAPGQAGAVEQADGAGGQQEQPEQVALFAGDSSAPGAIARTTRNSQISSPTNSRICQPRPEIDILVALVSPEERVGVGEFVLDAQPFAGRASRPRSPAGRRTGRGRRAPGTSAPCR